MYVQPGAHSIDTRARLFSPVFKDRVSSDLSDCQFCLRESGALHWENDVKEQAVPRPLRQEGDEIHKSHENLWGFLETELSKYSQPVL